MTKLHARVRTLRQRLAIIIERIKMCENKVFAFYYSACKSERWWINLAELTSACSVFLLSARSVLCSIWPRTSFCWCTNNYLNFEFTKFARESSGTERKFDPSHPSAWTFIEVQLRGNKNTIRYSARPRGYVTLVFSSFSTKESLNHVSRLC